MYQFGKDQHNGLRYRTLHETGRLAREVRKGRWWRAERTVQLRLDGAGDLERMIVSVDRVAR